MNVQQGEFNPLKPGKQKLVIPIFIVDKSNTCFLDEMV